MPFYEYRCGACGHQFDRFLPASAMEHRNEPQPCPACEAEGTGDAPCRRLFSSSVGYKIGRQGLLNHPRIPNDGVHGLAKNKRRVTFGAGGQPKTGGK